MGFCAVVQHVRLPMHHQRNCGYLPRLLTLSWSPRSVIVFLKYLVLPPFRYHRFEVLVWLQILMSGTAMFWKWASQHPKPRCVDVSLFQNHLSVYSTSIKNQRNVGTIVSDRPCHVHQACFFWCWVDKMKMRIALELHLELLKMRHTIEIEQHQFKVYNNASVILGH